AGSGGCENCSQPGRHRRSAESYYQVNPLCLSASRNLSDFDMVGHRQVAFFVTVIPARQNRSANNELIFCEKPYLSY
ncbi:hypothetical protein LAM67_22480, partial [Mycobacterium tuberculosis]|nr:hypothetical protein [Mycobacterium tuberculosis]